MKRREALRTMSVLAISGVAADNALAKSGKPVAKKVASHAVATPVLGQAWASYYAAIDEMRALVESTAVFQKYPESRAKAYHTLMEMQAMAYNFAIAPRMAHPRIYLNSGWQTDQYTLGQNGPDFRYGVLFIDGRQSYRLHGRMGDHPVILCQTLNGLLGEKGVKTTANYDWNDFTIGSDGSFEVIISATKQSGNWIKIAPDVRYQFLLIRRALPNWHGDRGEMNIDIISELPEGYYDDDEFDESVMAARIRRAEDFLRYLVKEFNIGLWDIYYARAGNQTNKLSFLPGTTTGQLGSPSSNYALGLFELKDDEALIIEMNKMPDGAYWSFELGDVWSRALPFHTRHSSLNNLQIARDSDGKLRAVISRRDPGVLNWLDTCAHDQGTIVFRNYRAKTEVVPTVTKVKFSELDALLPTDVARVTLRQRKEIIEDRRLAQLKWYGE